MRKTYPLIVFAVLAPFLLMGASGLYRIASNALGDSTSAANGWILATTGGKDGEGFYLDPSTLSSGCCDLNEVCNAGHVVYYDWGSDSTGPIILNPSSATGHDPWEWVDMQLDGKHGITFVTDNATQVFWDYATGLQTIFITGSTGGLHLNVINNPNGNFVWESENLTGVYPAFFGDASADTISIAATECLGSPVDPAILILQDGDGEYYRLLMPDIAASKDITLFPDLPLAQSYSTIDENGQLDWLGIPTPYTDEMAQDACLGNVVAGYGQAGTYDDVAGHYDFSLIHSDVVHYQDLLAALPVGIKALTPWVDGTTPSGSLAAQPDVPRNLMFTCSKGTGSMTGTITIDGWDQDGTVIQEVLNVNVIGAPVIYYTNRAFSYIGQIVIDQTDVTVLALWSAGWSDKLGIPNYPFGSTSDLFKVKTGLTTSVKASIPAKVDITYGTYDGGPVAAGSDITFWIRNSRLI